MEAPSIPKTMQAAQLVEVRVEKPSTLLLRLTKNHQFNSNPGFEINDIPTPVIGTNDVLIKVAAAR